MNENQMREIVEIEITNLIKNRENRDVINDLCFIYLYSYNVDEVENLVKDKNAIELFKILLFAYLGNYPLLTLNLSSKIRDELSFSKKLNKRIFERILILFANVMLKEFTGIDNVYKELKKEIKKYKEVIIRKGDSEKIKYKLFEINSWYNFITSIQLLTDVLKSKEKNLDTSELEKELYEAINRSIKFAEYANNEELINLYNYFKLFINKLIN